MKKLWIAISGLISLMVFTNASPWEGPAAAALGGELPDEGYYVATNAFPRNTVVDVTNLETGKGVRVIVVSGLDSPGFLAILSREAAAEVELQGRSAALIRMSQPGDPMAFSRFIDGAAPSTDPDYNPQAAVEGTRGQTRRGPGETPPSQGRPKLVQGDQLVIPDLAGNKASPGPSGPPPDKQPPSPPVQAPPAVPLKGEGYDLSLFPAENRPPAAPSSQGLPPDAEIPPPNRASYPPEAAQAAPVDKSMFIAPIGQVPPTGGPVSPAPAPFPPAGNYAGIMAPIETVPPIPPASLGVDRIPPGMAAAEIAPIERIQSIPPAFPAAPPQGEIPPFPSPPPEPESVEKTAFSAPLINSLERSKYYLQLGAFTRTELVEQELVKIGKNYPLVVLRGEQSGKSLYRILLGPVSQGESNALLQRFKNMGYKDAFLRQGS
jgi:hypothetical protein